MQKLLLCIISTHIQNKIHTILIINLLLHLYKNDAFDEIFHNLVRTITE